MCEPFCPLLSLSSCCASSQRTDDCWTRERSNGKKKANEFCVSQIQGAVFQLYKFFFIHFMKWQKKRRANFLASSSLCLHRLAEYIKWNIFHRFFSFFYFCVLELCSYVIEWWSDRNGECWLLVYVRVKFFWKALKMGKSTRAYCETNTTKWHNEICRSSHSPTE